MVEKSQSPESGAPDEGATAAVPPPRRGPGHRGADVRDTVAEMAAKAQEISLEAGTKVGAAMKDVISAAVGLAGFAIESARDLVHYMVRRGQLTQDEADKLLREAEDAHVKRGGSSLPTRSAMKAAEMKAAADAKAAAAAAAPRPAAYFQNPVPRQVIPPRPAAKDSEPGRGGDPRGDSKPEAKPESRPGGTASSKPDSRPQGKAAATSGGQAKSKGGAKSDSKPQGKAVAKAGASEGKSGARADAKAAAKPPAKGAAKSGKAPGKASKPKPSSATKSSAGKSSAKKSTAKAPVKKATAKKKR